MLDKCELWEPTPHTPQPTSVPKDVHTFTAHYPVYIKQIRPNILKRSWFWLWVCNKCRHETIEAVPYVQVCSCSALAKKSHITYPRQKKNTCNTCGTKFIYEQTQESHINKYCSYECKQKNIRAQSQNRANYNRKIATLRKFDRTKICIKNKYELCVNYSKCQDYRIKGELGPYYSPEGCYVYAEHDIIDVKNFLLALSNIE